MKELPMNLRAKSAIFKKNDFALKMAGLVLVISSLLAQSAIAGQMQQQDSVGKPFALNLNEVCREQLIPQDSDSLKIVVFMPNDSAYESMLGKSLSHYFENQDAFSSPLNGRIIKVIYVKSARPDPDVRASTTTNSYQLNISSQFFTRMMQKVGLASSCTFAEGDSANAQKKIADQLGMAFPKVNNASASLFLLDEKNIVQWRDDDYAAQGEHLKPLERKIKSLLNAQDPIAAGFEKVERLKVGDDAPNFKINDQQYLSDLKGKARLITFYPAAFSGTLDTSMCTMCCAIQITSLASSEGITEFAPKQGLFREAVENATVERFAISASTPALLTQWEQLLKTKGHIQMVNDVDYAISQAYSSYDYEKAYNRRSVFIVDKNGKLAFIDWDYTREDNAAVQKALEEISKS
jgi:alkyl hydroperoxide reductase subunit AhpC